MHYTGAEWLVRDVREREERCSLLLANLGIRPGHDHLRHGLRKRFLQPATGQDWSGRPAGFWPSISSRKCW